MRACHQLAATWSGRRLLMLICLACAVSLFVRGDLAEEQQQVIASTFATTNNDDSNNDEFIDKEELSSEEPVEASEAGSVDHPEQKVTDDDGAEGPAVDNRDEERDYENSPYDDDEVVAAPVCTAEESECAPSTSQERSPDALEAPTSLEANEASYIDEKGEEVPAEEDYQVQVEPSFFESYLEQYYDSSLIHLHNPDDCTLYMAESSIPHAGWGMYTAKALEEEERIGTGDVVVLTIDVGYHRKTLNSILYPNQPKRKFTRWLMNEYYWQASESNAGHEADEVDAIIPSVGMLANSHTGLVNADNEGALSRRYLSRAESPMAGAYTSYYDLGFFTNQALPVGHELMAEYGDAWFRRREKNFGAIPLSSDFHAADEVMDEVEEICGGNFNSDFCRDLWKLVRDDLEPATNPRLFRALPDTLEEMRDILDKNSTAAYHSVPNVIRTIPWLQENGYCLDHIEMKPSNIKDAGDGAMATRDLPANGIIAPLPVVHLHRNHIKMFGSDVDDRTHVGWEGYQLLLNYVYGHDESSLLFFPYSPVVNALNHSPKPNAKLRWSPKMAHPEWLDWTTDELIAENKHAGLMMELVALRDIKKGEEVTIDYGESWVDHYEEHVEQWEPPRGARKYTDSSHWQKKDPLPLYNDRDPLPGDLPPNLYTGCWINTRALKDKDEHGHYVYRGLSTKRVHKSHPCRIHQARRKPNAKKKGEYEYVVSIKEIKKGGNKKKRKEVEKFVARVPRRAIVVLDQPYTINQFLRNSFRHYISLPDEMVGPNWRDLAPEHSSYPQQCQLYMAMSSIPNAGLGMYSGKAIPTGEQIGFDDLVVQVEDSGLNYKLRNWHNKVYKFPDHYWLMQHYYWEAKTTGGEREADEIDSIVPGFGMLANSHDGLINTDMIRPRITSVHGMHRTKDPGAGAFTYYHGVKYMAEQDIAVGEEIWAEYGSSWFLEREDELGIIPIDDDFDEADSMLKKFSELVGGNVESEMARDLWEFFNITGDEENDNRVRVALPSKLEDVKHVAEIGTARHSVPDSIRSIVWLEENGLCLDNIRPGVSSIPQAGKGAFATRFMKSGEVIAPAPLVQLRRVDMEVYDSDDIRKKKARTWRDGTQLLLNYCFGHPQSSILLFPYAPVVNYINHGEGREANAMIRWSAHEGHQRNLLLESPEELNDSEHAGLMLEFVATRDIRPGEEVLLDYGEVWQEAWIKHLEDWEPPSNEKDLEYVNPEVLNSIMEPVRTIEEQQEDPYPQNIQTVCHVGPIHHNAQATKDEWGEGYNWVYFDWMYHNNKKAFPCDILERDGGDLDDYQSVEPDDSLYIAKVRRGKKKRTWIVRRMPRRAIEFYDRKYSSDQFQRSAFRHEIGLPSEMLPKAWRDRNM